MSTATPLEQPLQRTISMRSLQTIKEDMDDKEFLIINDQAESAEASPKVAEANDGSEFMMITVGHCRNVVPAPKYHAELDMTSRPKMSQKEYEEFMMAKHDILQPVLANSK